jgi:integrase
MQRRRSAQGIPDAEGGRASDQGGPCSRALRCPGCYGDPGDLSARAAGRRAGWLAVGPDRLRPWSAACAPAGARLARTSAEAKFPFLVHPRRHACGFKLANDGQDTRTLQHYLGHKNIQHTVRYTELSPERFKDFWKD